MGLLTGLVSHNWGSEPLTLLIISLLLSFLRIRAAGWELLLNFSVSMETMGSLGDFLMVLEPRRCFVIVLAHLEPCPWEQRDPYNGFLNDSFLGDCNCRTSTAKPGLAPYVGPVMGEDVQDTLSQIEQTQVIFRFLSEGIVLTEIVANKM